MRKTIAIVLIAIAAMSANAQNIIKSGVYLKAPGLIIPMESFGYSTNYTGNYNSLGGAGFDATLGLNIYLIEKPALGINPGIDLTIASLSVINHKVYIPDNNPNDPYNYYEPNQNFHFTGFQMGVGPLVTFCPIEKLFIDLYGKANLAFGSQEYYPQNDPTVDEISKEAIFFARYCGGINLCYQKFGITAEYNYGQPKIKKVVDNTVETQRINAGYFRLGVMFRFATVK